MSATDKQAETDPNLEKFLNEDEPEDPQNKHGEPEK